MNIGMSRGTESLGKCAFSSRQWVGLEVSPSFNPHYKVPQDWGI